VACGLVEKTGVNLFTHRWRAIDYDRDGIAGVITEDKGVDKTASPKTTTRPDTSCVPNYCLAEGPRGSLTKQLVQKNKLDNINPQIYSIGVKNCGTCSPDASARYVAHTLAGGAHGHVWRRLDLCWQTIASPSAW